MNPLFLLRNVRKARGRGPGYALHIPHLRIEHGARVAITGPSGCGKSTALDILSMALAVDEGEAFLFTPHPRQRTQADAGIQPGEKKGLF